MDHSIAAIYERSQRQWVGCDWPTEFGPARLNLNNVAARQAELLARATCGQESSQWREAAQWLSNVEADAEAAQQAAEAAILAVANGRLDEALTGAQRACDIERSYHTKIVWEQLREAIRRKMANTDAG